MKPIPVIFDCDPGHDDAIALIAALASDKLDVRGVTTVCGNSSVDNTTRNALKVLELAGRADIPVAKGAARPIMGEARTGANVHGESGMEGPVLPEPGAPPSPLSAVALMEKIVSESGGPVTIIITGPCTNVAAFFLSRPDLKAKIARVSIMGGGYLEGNRTAVAEFNIWHDPEAAQIVMSSGVPIDLYGLDVTHKALILKEETALFRGQGDDISAFVADLLDFFAVYYTGRGALAGCPMHDSCAVAGLIEPRMFTFEHCSMEVDLYGRLSRGGVALDLRVEPRRDYPYNGRVALDVDRPGFLALLLDSCQKLARRKEAAQ
ncbi:MAG: nucleoside hydrolase [Clostridiales bacterium]|jgi:pyrimidine-specific ribonucleoside hydrolase|nr:nucleoside hydrolase [Clostridiales bacterium]